jgi:tripartite-type tricarboxylate transporter receptor subunit TctC
LAGDSVIRADIQIRSRHRRDVSCGLDYEASNWFGVCAPNATPAEIVEKLNKEINAGLADPKIKARLADLGATTLPGSPSDFRKHIAEETEKWAKVIQFAGIKPE